MDDIIVVLYVSGRGDEEGGLLVLDAWIPRWFV